MIEGHKKLRGPEGSMLLEEEAARLGQQYPWVQNGRGEQCGAKHGMGSDNPCSRAPHEGNFHIEHVKVTSAGTLGDAFRIWFGAP